MTRPNKKRKRTEDDPEVLVRNQAAKEKIVDLVNKVNTAQIEGQYEERNLCAPDSMICKLHKDVRKFVEQDDFEVVALMDEDNAHTGYAKCSLPSCQARMIAVGERVFKCQDSASSGVKKQLLMRHFNRFHKTNVESFAQRDEMLSDSSQSTITQFVRRKGRKLSDKTVENLRASNAQIIASAHTPLGFFGKEELRKRDQILLIEGGYDPEEVYRFDKGETTTKRDIFKISRDHLELIRRCGPKLAEKNLLAVTIDHQVINRLVNHPETKAFGVGLTLSADRNSKNEPAQRHSYLMKYEPCQSATHEDAIKLTKKTLEERITNSISISFNSKLKK